MNKKSLVRIILILCCFGPIYCASGQTKEKLIEEIGNIIKENNKVVELTIEPCLISWKEQIFDKEEPYYITKLDLRGAIWTAKDFEIQSDEESVITYNSSEGYSNQTNSFMHRMSLKANKKFAKKINALSEFCKE